MNTEATLLLARLSWVAAGAILAVLLLRRPLRALAGPDLAYAVWLLVPVALLAALLPATPTPVANGALVLLRFEQVAAPALARGIAAADVPWLALWAAGGLAMLAWCVLSQVRYVRGLGALVAHAGAASASGAGLEPGFGAADGARVFFGATPAAGPALVGLWRPRVVLPCDFGARFSATERALIIAHERAHAQRRDPLANAVLALLQCLFWFHPLVHLGARRFRDDQELACDAAVMRTHAGARRSYAAAMLKTATGMPATSLVHSCHWQSTHPLKERIMSLQQTPPRRARRLAGRLAIAALVCASGYAALAARAADAVAPAAGMYAVSMTIDAFGKQAQPVIHTRADTPFTVANSSDDGTGSATAKRRWEGKFMLHRMGEQVQIDSTIKYNGAIVSEPKLLGKLGDTMGVAIGASGNTPAFKMSLTITELPAS